MSFILTCFWLSNMGILIFQIARENPVHNIMEEIVRCYPSEQQEKCWHFL